MLADIFKTLSHRPYLATKKLSASLREIKLNNNGNYYCIYCLYSFKTEKLKARKNVCKNQDYCYIKKPQKVKNIVKYNHGENSMKIAFVIYAETESLFEKLHAYLDNPEKLSITIVNKHTAFTYSSFTQFSFDSNKNKHDYYRGKDCVKNFCKYLKEHLMKITIFEILKILPLKERENKSNRKQKLCYICKDKFNKNMEIFFCKVRDDFHHTGKDRGAAHLLCNLRHKIKFW